VPIEDLLDAGPFATGLKSSIEYFAMSVGIGRTLMSPRLRHPTNFRIDPKII